MSIKINNTSMPQEIAQASMQEIGKTEDVAPQQATTAVESNIDLQQIIADADVSFKQVVAGLLRDNVLFNSLSDTQQRTIVGLIENKLQESPMTSSLLKQIKSAA